MSNAHVYLTRKNLQDLLRKLDRNRAQPGASVCTLVKHDTIHPTYPITGASSVTVTAVEDEDYYLDRLPGVTYEDLNSD